MLHAIISTLHEELNMHVYILMYMHVSCNMLVTCMDFGRFSCMLHEEYVHCMLEFYNLT